MEYLGFLVIRNGVKSINKKIEEITNMNPPTFQKEVQNSMFVANCYRNMLPRWSHTLAPLTKLMSNKIKFKWTKIKKYAID